MSPRGPNTEAIRRTRKKITVDQTLTIEVTVDDVATVEIVDISDLDCSHIPAAVESADGMYSITAATACDFDDDGTPIGVNAWLFPAGTARSSTSPPTQPSPMAS